MYVAGANSLVYEGTLSRFITRGHETRLAT
jgi:hypothetical protein